MIHAGDIIENPVTGERIVFRKTSRETTARPSSSSASCSRTASSQRPTCTRPRRSASRCCAARSASGSARGDTRAGPGERITVPAGTPHRFWNAGDEEAHFVCEVRPALQFEQLVETMFALAADGKTNRKGMPNPLRLAVIAEPTSTPSASRSRPRGCSAPGSRSGAPLGRLLGYGATYEPRVGALGPRGGLDACAAGSAACSGRACSSGLAAARDPGDGRAGDRRRSTDDCKGDSTRRPHRDRGRREAVALRARVGRLIRSAGR